MRWGLVVALALWGGLASAQVATDAAGLREIAARLIEGGEAEQARGLAQALLARDPGDVAALLLLGRADLALGDFEGARDAGLSARGAARTDGERFLAARLVAKAHAELGQYSRAQIWLRLAREDAPSAEAAEAVARDFRAVRDRNPLSVSLSFGVAPTSNVNGGSSSETITLPGLPVEFLLDGEARALSGFRVSAGASLSYRIARSERSETALDLQASGRTYALSAGAKDQAPEARGSDFADYTLSAGLAHRWRGEGASGPSSVRLSDGWTFYDGEPYSGYLKLDYSRAFVLSETDRLDLSLFREWAMTERSGTREVIDPDTGQTVKEPYEFFVPFGSVGGSLGWGHVLASKDRTNLLLGLRAALSDVADASYDGVTLGAGYDWGRPVMGLKLGVSAGAEWRRYETSVYTEDERDDRTLRLRGSVGLPRYDVYGFYPTVSLEAFRTDSNADLYDKGGLTLDIGFRSSF